MTNMAFRVVRIPGLCYEPFYIDMERRGVRVVDLPPEELMTALDEGEIDAAPVALPDWFRIEDRFDPVAGFCVSANNRAVTGVLYSRIPLEELGGAPIGIAQHDSAWVELLRVLLSVKYGQAPGLLTSPQDSPEALLLTGNDALRRRRSVRGYPHRYDLGQEWREWTHLPFVFSRWVARKDAAPQDLALLEDTLYVGLEDGVDGLYHLSEPRDDVLMLAKDVMAYIQGLRYYVGLSEQKSIHLFREYLDRISPIG